MVTLTDVMGNWWFVLATALIVLVLPLVGRAVRPEAFGPIAAQPGVSREPVTLPSVVPEARIAAEGVADARS